MHLCTRGLPLASLAAICGRIGEELLFKISSNKVSYFASVYTQWSIVNDKRTGASKLKHGLNFKTDEFLSFTLVDK